MPASRRDSPTSASWITSLFCLVVVGGGDGGSDVCLHACSCVSHSDSGTQLKVLVLVRQVLCQLTYHPQYPRE